MSASESKSGSKRSQRSLDQYFARTGCVKKRKIGDEEGKEITTSRLFEEAAKTPDWSNINQNDMNISFAVIFTKEAAKGIFKKLESEIEYFSGALAQV